MRILLICLSSVVIIFDLACDMLNMKHFEYTHSLMWRRSFCFKLGQFSSKWKSTEESEWNSLVWDFTSLQLVMTHGCKHSRRIGSSKETQTTPPPLPPCLQVKSFINFNNFFSLQNLTLVQGTREHSSCLSTGFPQGGAMMHRLVLTLTRPCYRACSHPCLFL